MLHSFDPPPPLLLLSLAPIRACPQSLDFLLFNCRRSLKRFQFTACMFLRRSLVKAIVCLSLVLTFPEPEAQFLSHWAAYGVTATLTSLTVRPFLAFCQYFISGFKRIRFHGWFPTLSCNWSARLNRGAVEPFLARIFLLWRVAGPLASFPSASPLDIIHLGVFRTTESISSRRRAVGLCLPKSTSATPIVRFPYTSVIAPTTRQVLGK